MASHVIYDCDRCGAEMRESTHDRYRLVLRREGSRGDKSTDRELDLCGFCANTLREEWADVWSLATNAEFLRCPAPDSRKA